MHSGLVIQLKYDHFEGFPYLGDFEILTSLGLISLSPRHGLSPPYLLTGYFFSHSTMGGHLKLPCRKL